MTSRSRRLLPAAVAIALTALGASPVANAAPNAPAGAAAPVLTEDFSYPGADDVLVQAGAKLVRGDGGITYVSCDSPHQIAIWARSVTLPMYRMCFAAPGAGGYLAMSIPDTFRLQTYGRDLHANLTTNGNSQPIDVPRDTFVGVGEGSSANAKSVLLELNVTASGTGLPAPQPTDPALAFVAKLNIGSGKRACTGALVDRYWVMTAASCFTDTPDSLATVTAGAPKDKTTATIGRTDLTNTGTGIVTDVVELVPRQDRDLVMARLAAPADGITPVALASAAPTAGDSLSVAGYGRTATEWVPTKIHTGNLTAGSVSATGLDLTWQGTSTTVCAGDAGASTTRAANGTTQLIAIASRSWQGGCLGTPGTETRTGAAASRVDDLASWVKDLRYRTADVKAGTHVQIIGADNTLWDTVADYKAGNWIGSWTPVGGRTLTAVDSVAIADTVHAFAIDTDTHVYTRDGRVGGAWTQWREVPGGAAGAKGITAAARGNTVSLQIIGADGSLYSTVADYTTGTWKGAWEKLGTNNLKAITTTDNVVHLFAVNENLRIYTRDSRPDGSWTEWQEIPGDAMAAKPDENRPGFGLITAAARGNIVDLQIIGSDGALYTTNGNFDTGHWNPTWQKVSDNNLKAITSSAEGNIVHVFTINEDGRVYARNADYNTGNWTPWREVPGGAAGAKAITATTTS